MYGNINALYKVSFIFSGKTRFILFNIPINLEHLIARLPQEDYIFGLFLLRFLF